MKAAIQTLGHVLYAPSQYVIPVFQRNYRWERPQWDKLWASLGEIRQPDKTGNHFMGFLVFVQGGTAQPGQNTRFHLIDGQQRLTTSSLLLAAIRNVAHRLGDAELAKEIHDYYLVHPLKKGEHHYRLLPKAQDHDAYIAIIQRKPVPAGRMMDALGFFEREMEGLVSVEAEALRKMFDTVCQRLEFMCATLESENAYSIFKSLNSTGVPLGQSDLIRNFVFMHVHPEAQDAFDRDHWSPLEVKFSDEAGRLDEERFSRFFRDFLMSAGQYVQPKETFATFEARNEATGFDPETLANRLLGQAEHYAVISGVATDESPDVVRALVELNRLESSTTYPLLLALFTARDAGRLDSAGLAKAIDMLRGFIFRRFVAGDSSRGYGQMFVRAIDSTAADPLAALEQYLLDRGWPHDARFIEAFALFPLYRRGYAREVLETLERARGHKEQADLSQVQIEHVMPQTLSAAWIDGLGEDAEVVHAEWIHRPGNLTLSAYNQEMGNQPFPIKRQRFAQSNVGLTRDLGEVGQWTAQEIQARGQQLAKDAAAIWPGPKEAHSSEDVAVQVRETKQVRMDFWTGFAQHLQEHHPELPVIQPVGQRGIRLSSGVPHLSVELRYKVQEDSVALDIYFYPKALELWSRVRSDPTHVNSLVGEDWTFEEAPSGYAWMTMNRSVPSSDPAHWPVLHGWLAQRLAHVVEHVLPNLREEQRSISPAAPTPSGDGDSLTETKSKQLRFWHAVAEALEERSSEVKLEQPMPRRWQRFYVGRAGFAIAASVNARDERLMVKLLILGEERDTHFHSLKARQSTIDDALGFPVEWQERPDLTSHRVVAVQPDSPLDDTEAWPEHVEWMVERIVAMHRVFRPLMATL